METQFKPRITDYLETRYRNKLKLISIQIDEPMYLKIKNQVKMDRISIRDLMYASFKKYLDETAEKTTTI